MKLNIDGLARYNTITCGAILRESTGKMIMAFSISFGNVSNNLAKFLALREGLELCHSLHLTSVIIELDS